MRKKLLTDDMILGSLIGLIVIGITVLLIG